MPGHNPKHNKKPEQTKPMGVKHEVAKCGVENCNEESAHSLSFQQIDEYISKLNFKFKTDPEKSKHVGLCKHHYKEYKKLKDKDEKLLRVKEFGSKDVSKREKPHYELN